MTIVSATSLQVTVVEGKSLNVFERVYQAGAIVELPADIATALIDRQLATESKPERKK